MSRNPRSTLPLVAALVCLAAGPAAVLGQEDSSYGFFRTVEGSVRLTTFDKAEPIEIEPNYPVLTGDRLWVTEGSRVELVLPDAVVVRAVGGTDLYLDSLAGSADSEEGAPTVLQLLVGEIQVAVPDYRLGDQPLRIELEDAIAYLQDAGDYVIRAEDGGYAEVAVRQGFAEIATADGSMVVRAGEASYLQGGGVTVAAAGQEYSVERWGQQVEGYAAASESSRYVDERLAYAAAPLDRHGSWVSVGGSWGWRPAVAGHWRPYTSGWWAYTPAGLTWVSNEPWGWVTSHYGVWDFAPGYGWLWYPGSLYSPAWVYWYWGPTHVAWVPAGYYSHFYGPSWGFGFRYGVYGWAGGSWDHFGFWTFCPVRFFGRRSYSPYWRSGHELARYGRFRSVPPGVIASDTRPLHPGTWGKPQEAYAVLKRRAAVHQAGGELPDVSDFVARRSALPEAVQRAVFDRRTDATITSSRSGAVGRARGSDVAAIPWKPNPRPSGAIGLAPSDTDTRLRDSAVLRGMPIETYRRPTASGGTPGYGSAPSRLGGLTGGDSAISRGSGTRPGFSAPQRPSVGIGTVRPSTPDLRLMPPSGRTLPPSGLRGGTIGPPSSGDRTPVIRSIIEGMRSRVGGSPSTVTPPPASSRGSSSPPPAARSGSSSSSRSSVRSSPPPSRGGSSAGSRGSSSSSSSSRGSARTRSKPPAS